MDRFGEAQACWALRTLLVRAFQAILLLRSLSRPLPRHDSKAMGRQDRGELPSRFPAFGITATSALRQTAAKMTSVSYRSEET